MTKESIFYTNITLSIALLACMGIIIIIAPYLALFFAWAILIRHVQVFTDDDSTLT